MNSVKCPQCGLVYWSTTPNCKRCGLATAGGPAEQHAAQPEFDQVQPYVTAPVPMKPIRSDIFDEEQLLRNLRKDSYLFYFIGGLQTLLWFVIGNLLIFDGICNIGLSFVAYKFRSRIAAVILLLLTVASVLIGMLAMAMTGARFNLFVPLLLLGRLAASIRMVYSTFRLNAQVVEDVTRMMPPLPPVFHKEDMPQWAPPAGAAQWQPSE
jgi:hypothetical protein